MTGPMCISNSLNSTTFISHYVHEIFDNKLITFLSLFFSLALSLTHKHARTHARTHTHTHTHTHMYVLLFLQAFGFFTLFALCGRGYFSFTDWRGQRNEAGKDKTATGPDYNPDKY